MISRKSFGDFLSLIPLWSVIAAHSVEISGSSATQIFREINFGNLEDQ